MSAETYRLLGWLTLGLAGVSTLTLVLLLRELRRRSALARPAWPRMLAETPYFHRALLRVFRARGYRVEQTWPIRDPIERQTREIVFALVDRRGRRFAALCGRWVIPITSEVIGRFDQALATTRADAGLIITTGEFTTAAIERAQGRPVQLYDGADLRRWLFEIWP
jgi:HJR/Mrr/RecB family endonuclease